MDFIERWFGVSPDGGAGSSEAFFLLAVAFVVGVGISRARTGRRTQRLRRKRLLDRS